MVGSKTFLALFYISSYPIPKLAQITVAIFKGTILEVLSMDFFTSPGINCWFVKYPKLPQNIIMQNLINKRWNGYMFM